MLHEGRFYLGHLGSIPVYVHWTFLFLVFVAFNGSVPTTGNSLEYGLLVLMALLVGIVLHELGHGLAAQAQGERGITITIWALGGLCQSGGQDPHPLRRILVLAAGPAVSLALWWAAGIGLTLLEHAPPWLLRESAVVEMLAEFLILSKKLNLMLFIFNMLPIFPLDGGQILYNAGLMVTRRQDLVRKFTLVCAVVGAVGYLAWTLQSRGDIPFGTLAVMGWLVFNAFIHLR